jgi:LPS O-antigen subunit length determinant protein (WzzB/FepE family)
VRPAEWADWIIAELEQHKVNDALTAEEAEESIRKSIQAIDTKLDRLMVGYLDNLFGGDEYRDRKNKLIAEKQELNEKLAMLAKNREHRFEPAIQFVLELKQAKIVASQGSAEEKRDFLKKVGSNLEIVNRTLRLVPRYAWQLVRFRPSCPSDTRAVSRRRDRRR